jgi:hypothetical protein
MKKRSLPGIRFGLIGSLLGALCTVTNAAESPPLRDDVTQMVMIMDGPRDPRCTERKIVKTEIVEARPDKTPAVERWTLDRCGKAVRYRVRYTPNPKGGDDFDVQLEK